MRIAYVNADSGVPVFGTKGSSIHVREVIEGFLRKGAEVHLFAPRLDGEKPAQWKHVRIHHLQSWFGVPPSGGPVPQKPPKGGTPNPLELRTALVNVEDRFDLLYERYSLGSCAAMEWARERGVPGILEVNAPLIEEQQAYRTLSNPVAAKEATQRAFQAATAIAVVSTELTAYVKTMIGSCEKVRVIPNAINPDRFPANTTASCPAPPGVFTVGFAGSLRPWHGLATLIEAFDIFRRKCANVRLLIVGDGPERDATRNDLDARALTPLTQFTGAVPAAEVPGLLASMDLTVAPYPQLSNFYFSPLKVYEYMAADRAVVASRIGQLQTLIQHGVTGWHVPPGDAAALAEAMYYLWQKPELRQQLGQAAREFVLKNHTWDNVVQSIIEMAHMTRPSQ